MKRYTLSLLVLLVSASCVSRMHRLAESGSEDEVRAAIQEGGDPNDTNMAGVTPLHRAISMGNIGAVRALLQAGANVNALNGEGESPFMYAARQARCEMMELILEKKPNLKTQSTDGKSALFMLRNRPICTAFYCSTAAQRKCTEDLLIRAGLKE